MTMNHARKTQKRAKKRSSDRREKVIKADLEFLNDFKNWTWDEEIPKEPEVGASTSKIEIKRCGCCGGTSHHFIHRRQ